MPEPKFDSMTAEEKFKFLERYCDNLGRAVRQLQADVQNLHERLRRVEEKPKA